MNHTLDQIPAAAAQMSAMREAAGRAGTVEITMGVPADLATLRRRGVVGRGPSPGASMGPGEPDHRRAAPLCRRGSGRSHRAAGGRLSRPPRPAEPAVVLAVSPFTTLPPVPITRIESMGWLRTAVGIALIVAPGVPMRLAGREEPTGASLLLMRTIGIRDLVVGMGTVAAARSPESGDGGRWTLAALASDTLDTVVGLASFRSIGKRDAWAAGGLAFLFACGDLVSVRGRAGGTP